MDNERDVEHLNKVWREGRAFGRSGVNCLVKFIKIKVLITGDTGFKGSWLSIWLDELGAEVFGVSHPPLVNECNYNVCLVEKNKAY